MYFGTLDMYSDLGQYCNIYIEQVSTNVEEQPTRNTFSYHRLTRYMTHN